MTSSSATRSPISLRLCRLTGLALMAVGVVAVSGCTVIAVVDTAASAVVGVGGLAVDAAVGTARLGGKAIGAVVGSDDAQ
jgi:hypothetical protein